MPSPQQYADTLTRVAALLRRKPMTARALAETMGCCRPVIYQRLRDLQATGVDVFTVQTPEGGRRGKRRGPKSLTYGVR